LAKILIIEDDVDIAKLVAGFFHAANFSTYIVHSGGLAIQAVKEHQPDLIILDIMLPVKDGIACCTEIRAFSDVPIIMLTAKTAEQDRLAGLSIGVDDYVCKPFSAPELVMRAQNILKRASGKLSNDGWKVNADMQTVSLNNADISLTKYEFSLFNLLYQSPGRVYSREQLLEFAFADHRDTSDRAIDNHVKNIRKQLKNAGVSQVVVESVYGLGYRFKKD